MNSKDRIQQLLELNKPYAKRFPKDASENFAKLIGPGYELQTHIEESSLKIGIKNQARKNFAVNLVSGLENYFRELIVQFEGRWSREGLNHLLAKEKMSLGEAFDFFDHKKSSQVSKELLIAESTGFLNMDTINYVFSKLLNKNDFYREIDSFVALLARTKTCKHFLLFSIKNTPTWRSDLADLIETRNRIIHEPNLKHIITPERTTEYFELCIRFASTVTRYVDHKLRVRKKKSTAKKDRTG